MTTSRSFVGHRSSPDKMMDEAEKYALSKASKSTFSTLGLAMMAGMFIGLAFLFYITVTTGSQQLGWGVSRFIGGIAFSMGLVLIVICGGELFTSSVLSSISVANKEIRFAKMLKVLGQVYVGNFLGASLLCLVVLGAGLATLDGGAWGANALSIASHKLHHTPVQAFALGLLCNLLVCLAIWMTFSSSNPLAKALLVVFPVAMFVSSGFEHSVANMFMVPLGIGIAHFASPEFWQQTGLNPAHFSDLSWGNFLVANLIPVTLGNIVGGALLVGMPNWLIYRRPQLKAVTSSLTLSSPLTQFIPGNKKMNTSVTIQQVMQTEFNSFHASTPLSAAVDRLLNAGEDGAPVVNDQSELIGFVSLHDVLIELWSEAYEALPELSVQEVMTSELVTVAPSDSALQVAEYIAIDKEALYPVTAMGMATSLNYQSAKQRAKTAKVSRPRIMPVVEAGQLVGVVSRRDMVAALRPLLGEHLEEMNSLQSA